MTEDPKHIKFNNSQNPNAAFDLVKIEELFRRTDLDHSPEQLHLVEFYMMVFIEDGQGVHTIDFTDYQYKKGTLLTIRKNQLHKFFKKDGIKGSLLLFTDEFLISYLENLETQKSLQLFNELLGVPKIQLPESTFDDVYELIKRIKNEYFDINDDHSLGIIRSELHILITKLYRIKSKREQLIPSRRYLEEFIAFQYLVENNVNKTTKVQDYAKMMGFSTKTLNTITKSIIHKTAKAFVDEICTKQIKRLLINTELPIKEIAYLAGFEETTNFYKYFKRQTTVTPEQFRAAYL